MTNTEKNSAIYNKAMKFSKAILNRLKERDYFGDMGLGGYCVLLEAVKHTELGAFYEYRQLSEQIRLHVNKAIERDITKWPYYTRRPSNYIRTADSIFYKDNEDILQVELDYIIDTRPKASVWGITWSWFENNDIYPKEFAISENWWKAIGAIETMKLLRAFNRLEG